MMHLVAGHLGVTKMLAKIRKRFYWPACREDVENWIQHCGPCNVSKGPSTSGRSKMQISNIGYPIATDIAGPFPETDQGNR